MDPQDLRLALDIGTRKVVGLLTVTGRDGLRIVAVEKVEHGIRSMYDGQIHDVPAVAAVVQTVKERLERRYGRPLREAAVAAAGRALCTCRGTARYQCQPGEALTAESILNLELSAVQAAQRQLAGELRLADQVHDYHYVGHSVRGQTLDGLPVTSLTGQRGEGAEMEVIATFLPRGVLDSLVAVLERVGLELTSLTLEPIAAVGAVVPASMRHLHLAMVDIGAGTADIAIVDQGTIVAYDMLPMAGDEITEALSEAYLLEFPVAERVKRLAAGEADITFVNILGANRSWPAGSVRAAMLPAVEKLAGELASRLTANGRVPMAVILVGGGSLSPGLPEAVARALGIAPDRVGVRGRDAIRGVSGARQRLSGPDAVTPIGIALSERQHPVGFAYVYVNGSGVRLFNPARLSAADALLAAGVDMRELQPRPGKGITIWVNGEMRLVPGQSGKPGHLTVNGVPAALDHPVRHRDRLEVTAGAPGQHARVTVADVAPGVTPITVVVAEGLVSLDPPVMVNGQAALLATVLQDNDRVDTGSYPTAAAVVAALHLPCPPGLRWQAALAGVDVSLQSPLPPGATLHLRRVQPPIAVATAQGSAAAPTLSVMPARAIRPDSVRAQTMRVRVNGSVMEFKPSLGATNAGGPTPGAGPIFAELLPNVPMVQSPPPGKTRLIMAINGRPAEFTAPIAEGDEIDIAWE